MFDGPGGGNSETEGGKLVDVSSGAATSALCRCGSMWSERDEPRRDHPSIVSLAVSVALIGTPLVVTPSIVRLEWAVGSLCK
jgi:hypothetical protein